MPDPAPLRTELLTAALGGTPGVERVSVARVELAPGRPTGRHFHPCPVVGYVLSGSVRFQVAGEPETML